MSSFQKLIFTSSYYHVKGQMYVVSKGAGVPWLAKKVIIYLFIFYFDLLLKVPSPKTQIAPHAHAKTQQLTL